jgi:hypothetical protein
LIVGLRLPRIYMRVQSAKKKYPPRWGIPVHLVAK